MASGGMNGRALLAWAVLPVVVPVACAWIARLERRILAEGLPLDAAQLADARALGVARPERVRVLCLPTVPLPENRLVRALGLRAGLLSAQTLGMAAQRGIFLRKPHGQSRHVLAHELVHVRQYERLGGLRPFLRQYLYECLALGYHQAPLEWEASEAAALLA